MPDDSIDWNILARHLAGEGTEADEITVGRWLAGVPPGRRAELDLMRRAWVRVGELPTEARLDGMWRAIEQTIESEARLAHAPRRASVRDGRRRSLMLPSAGPFRISARRTLLGAAAAAVVMLGGTLAWWRGRDADLRPWTAGAVSTREFHTVRGQRGSITLLDGTRVELGVDSHLRVGRFDGRMREIHLTGEAVFDVVHDERSAFVVHTGGAVMEDLGTEFVVRAYEGEPLRVVVASGAVRVRASTGAAATAVLAPQQLARVRPDGTIEVEHGVDPALYLAWTRGQLVFRRVPLRHVAADLERWFDVRVVVADAALLDVTVNASFDGGGLDEVVGVLATSLDLRVERRGRTITFRPPR